MIAQVQLVLSIMNSAVLYFVQRFPQSLGRFRWRIDQKSSERTEYERAFLTVLPAFLQSASLREPMPTLARHDASEARALIETYITEPDIRERVERAYETALELPPP